MDGEPLRASKKRLLLSLYLDYLMFTVAWRLLIYAFALYELPSWFGIVVFAVVKAATHRAFGSPGMYLLSINRQGTVDPNIHHGENWLTILLGVASVLEGSKQLVRWTQVLAPQPFFGVFPGEAVQIAIHAISGCLLICTGHQFLKLRVQAFWLTLVYCSVTVASAAISWSLWDESAAAVVQARRALQGIPVRPNEIEFMQALMPEDLIAFVIVIFLAASLAYRRLNSHA